VSPAASRRLIYAAAFLRAVATSLVGVLLGLHLAGSGLSSAAIGLVVSTGLVGAAAAALAATLAGDRLGRRRLLVGVALLGAAGVAAVDFAPDPATLLVASFLGMVNGMGRDRGAALILEQAILPAMAPPERRTLSFAWYNVLQDAGHGLGGLLATVPPLLRRAAGLSDPVSLQVALGLAAALLATSGALYLALPPLGEAGAASPPLRRRVSPETRPILWKVTGLFALDSLGGGFLSAALVSLFFHERFGVGEAALGPLFLAARLMNALSHFGAAWLARRIGLVNTMVFTHIPSSLALATVAFAPSFPVAAALFLLREGLVEMDVPTRQSYVMAVVKPEERTFASGVTHLVRLGGWAVAPSFAGALMGTALGAPLVVAAGLKIGYDVLLWLGLRRHRPPEERGAELRWWTPTPPPR
jgi:MFS family permease